MKALDTSTRIGPGEILLPGEVNNPQIDSFAYQVNTIGQ